MSTHTISFIEAAGPVRSMCVGNFMPGDSHTRLAMVGGYLKGYRIETFGSFDRIALVDANGAPIVSTDSRGLRVMTGDPHYVPVAIDDDAVGALPDMSSEWAYIMQISRATERGRIIAEYWPLPDHMSSFGVPQSVTPRKAGTSAWVTDIRHCQPDYRDDFIMHRVGNHILFLAILFDKPLLTGLLRYDLNELTDISSVEDHIVLIDRTLDTALPTTLSTRLAIERAHPLPDSITWLVRDVAKM